MVYFRQDKLIFYPNMPGRALTATPANIGLPYQVATVRTKDNVLLHSWYIPHPQEKAVVLFCHGNAGNISHRLQTIKTLHDLKLSVFIFDYRGYGESEGNVSEAGTYLDAQAAWQYLTQTRNYHPDHIILWGRSLGAAVAANLSANLATKSKAKALILESSFTSVPDLAASIYPLLPVRLLSRYQYDVVKNIKTIHSPVLIIHSRDDEIIPFSLGKKLFDAANEPKSFLEIRGGHNEGIIVSHDVYTEKLLQFLESLK
ncbi:MAG: alpha/beta hydrolase [Gammaproteobacteria bacterium]|nr:alpha/beta hydrolase [Gammaproteobacteria bacterium]